MMSKTVSSGSSSSPKRIVIVGGGVGGLVLATRLGKQFRADKTVEVLLVDKTPVHVWKPMLHCFAAGTANAHEDGIPFVAQAKAANFRFIPGEFIGLDTAKKIISLQISDLPSKPLLKHELAYDIAVLAIGSRSNDFNVGGVREHCHFVDNLWQSEHLNQSLREEIIFKSITDGDINIAVIGGGATGVETAAEISYLTQVGESYGAINLSKRLRVTIFDASDTILNGFSDDIAERVTKRLCETGVTVRTGERISVIKSGQIEFESGDAFQADIIVWAAGVKAPEAIAELSVLQRTKSGQIKVNDYLQSSSDPSVYAIGDCSSYMPEGDEIPLPPTGQVARQQAEYLARSIQLIFAGNELKPFQYVDRGNLVSLSVFGAYGNVAKQSILPQLALRGPLAILAHKAFYRMHQFALHGAIKGSVLMLRDWLNTLVKPPVRMD